jgi:alcohol dehydrogenase class IV
MSPEPSEADGVATYEALSGRVVSGLVHWTVSPRSSRRSGRAGCCWLPASVADELGGRLGDRHAATFGDIVQHVPVEVAQRARRLAREADADTLDTLVMGDRPRRAIPIVDVPTTYAGSELTTIYGLSQGGCKQTGRDTRILPKIVLYDPTL